MKRLGFRKVIVVALLVCLAISMAHSSPAPTVAPTPAQAAFVVPKKAVKVSHYLAPVRLVIPKASVDAKIQPLGLTDAGNLDVPTNTVDVGWYKLGAAPGNKGSAVIDGHVNGAYDSHGVFEHLKDLKRGDKMYTVDAKGNVASFKVQSIKDYDNSAHPKEVFAATGRHLNLITCDGIWDAKTKLYSQRLVIFAVAIER